MFPCILKQVTKNRTAVKRGYSTFKEVEKNSTSVTEMIKNELSLLKDGNIESTDRPAEKLLSTKESRETSIEPSVDYVKTLNQSTVRDYTGVYPYVKQGSVFASSINESDFLKELLKLGVNFYELERNLETIPFILGLRFEDVKDHIIFLRELGLEKHIIGQIITKNPFIFKEDLENLNVRVNYLQYKKFTNNMILRILEKNPNWLSYSTQDIDNKLGFFQNNFNLSGDEVRFLTVRCPKLITYNPEKIKLNIFVLKEEMGLLQEEMKKVILKKPKIFMNGQKRLLNTFDYLHNTMKIPIETIVEIPEILTCRQSRLKQRHLFLEKLGRAQYNPKKPNYVALASLVADSDSNFATELAKSSITVYNEFLKSL
ncbi:unnamed protein product [Callosobruchus maculatus]|uniref:mTERF domain-containing protein 1, mitochondrial n=1 Tax=Callosobruchus maculatus TaxID=64391 RepID=A0A653CD61_CALMS|nr:unnamed protein product [Callosobruchus maculatus]